MEQEGLMDPGSKVPKATVKGVDLLQRNLLQIKDFIDRSIDRLEIVRSTDAIAAASIRKGDHLNLYIEDGFLYGEPGEGAPSTGMADNDCEKGEIVMVSGLSGVIDLPRSMLITVEIVPARQGGGGVRMKSTIIDDLAREHGFTKHLRTAVLDQEAASLMKRSGIPYDMELPKESTLKDTLMRGLSLICIGTPHTVEKVLNSTEILSMGYETMKMELSDLDR
jgi:predicted transcriptional regulator